MKPGGYTGTKKFSTTRSGGSSSAAGEQDKYLRVNPITKETKEVRPEPLIKLAEEDKNDQKGVDASKVDKTGATKGGKESGVGKDKAAETSQPKAKAEDKDAKKKEEKDASVSMQSGGFNSLLLETSEDEEAKTKAKEKEENKKKKGLTEEELSEIIDIELCETETMWLMHFPSAVINDVSENQHVVEQNDRYK